MIANPEPATPASASRPHASIMGSWVSVQMHLHQPEGAHHSRSGAWTRSLSDPDEPAAACLVWSADMQFVRVRARCQVEFNPGTWPCAYLLSLTRVASALPGWNSSSCRAATLSNKLSSAKLSMCVCVCTRFLIIFLCICLFFLSIAKGKVSKWPSIRHCSRCIQFLVGWNTWLVQDA